MTYYPSQTASSSEPASPGNSWRRIRPGADDRRTSLFFWLTVLGLGCISLFCVTWAASNVLAKKGSEKLLRVELLLPKLKSIKTWHLTAPLTHAPAGVDHAKIVETPHETPHLVQEIESWLHLTPKVEANSPHHDSCGEPVIYLNACTPQPGDSPMMRTWKTLTMYSLLSAAAVTFAPPPIIFAHDPNDAPKTAGVEELRKDIKALIKRIDELEKKPAVELDKGALAKVVRDELRKLEDGALADITQDLKGVKKSVDGLKGDISALQGDVLKHKLLIDSQKAQMEILAEQIAGLNKKLTAISSSAAPIPAVDKAFMEEFRSSMLKAIDEKVAKLGPTKERKSMSLPTENTPPPMGRVMLINHYTEDILFIVNGLLHRVPAGSQRILENVPAGALRL